MYSEPKNDLGKTVWLKFEVTNEVTDEKIEKIQCFQGFPTSGRKKYGLKAARRAPQFIKR